MNKINENDVLFSNDTGITVIVSLLNNTSFSYFLCFVSFVSSEMLLVLLC